MTSDLQNLGSRIGATTGPSRDLDHEIASAIDRRSDGQQVREYTSSVDTCLTLIRRVLPDWHWHVGHGPRGILPYASLLKTSNPGDGEEIRVEATAPTVPLALLHAAVKALIADQEGRK